MPTYKPGETESSHIDPDGNHPPPPNNPTTINGAADSDTDDDVVQLSPLADQVLAEQEVLARLATSPNAFVVSITSANTPGGATSLFTIESDLLPLSDAVIPLSAPSARAIVLSLCGALAHLHELGIMHRDVKPENVLIPSKGLEGEVKLTGFSSASLQTNALSLVGTPEFMAPEMLLAQMYTKAVDWWALGCLLSELLTGETPFAQKDVANLVRKIVHDPIVVPTHANVGALELDFITALITRDPFARLGAGGHNQVLAHPWCGSHASNFGSAAEVI